MLPGPVWNSVVRVATDDRLFYHATRFSTQQYCYVSLCGFPFRCWAVLAPTHFHFTITALTLPRVAEAGQKFDELTCWKGGNLWQCHIECHWALHYDPFYCQCLSMEIATTNWDSVWSSNRQTAHMSNQSYTLNYWLGCFFKWDECEIAVRWGEIMYFIGIVETELPSC